MFMKWSEKSEFLVKERSVGYAGYLASIFSTQNINDLEIFELMATFLCICIRRMNFHVELLLVVVPVTLIGQYTKYKLIIHLIF